jgi:hypothetical protein
MSTTEMYPALPAARPLVATSESSTCDRGAARRARLAQELEGECRKRLRGTPAAAELVIQIEEILERYDRGRGLDLVASARSIALDEIIELVHLSHEPVGLAQAWAVLARTLAGDPRSSRHLRAVLSQLIDLLDLIRADDRGAPGLTPAEEQRIREKLREEGFDVAPYRGANSVVFVGARLADEVAP